MKNDKIIHDIILRQVTRNYNDKWSTNDFLTIPHHLQILLAIWDGGRPSQENVAGDEVFLREEGEEHLVAFLVSSVSGRHSEVLHTYRCLHLLLRRPDVHVSHEVEGVLIEAEYEANTRSDSQHSVEREEEFEKKSERH